MARSQVGDNRRAEIRIARVSLPSTRSGVRLCGHRSVARTAARRSPVATVPAQDGPLRS